MRSLIIAFQRARELGGTQLRSTPDDDVHSRRAYALTLLLTSPTYAAREDVMLRERKPALREDSSGRVVADDTLRDYGAIKLP